MNRSQFKPLGFLAICVVVLRALAKVAPEISQFEVVYDLIIVLLSVAITVDTIPSEIGVIAVWLFYLAVFYSVLPQLFPTRLKALKRDRILIALLSITGSWYGIYVFTPFFADIAGYVLSGAQLTVNQSQQINRLVGTLAVTIFLFGLYGYWQYGDPLDADTESHHLVVFFGKDNFIDEIVAYREASPVFQWVGRGIGLLTVGSIFSGVTFTLGGVTAVLSGLSPLPESIFVVGLVFSYLPLETPEWAQGDIETRFQESLRANLINTKSFLTTVVIIPGLVYGVITIVIGLRFMIQQASFLEFAVKEVSREGYGYLLSRRFGANLAWVASPLLIVTGGLMYLIYWGRILIRLPNFIRAWDGNLVAKVTASRPPNFAVDAAFLVLAGLSVPMTVTLLPYELYHVYHRWFGVLWPLGMVLSGRWVYSTWQCIPQPALSDQWAVPAGFIVTVSPYIIYNQNVAHTLLYLWLPVLFFLPDVDRWEPAAGLNSKEITIGMVAVVGFMPLVMGHLVFKTVPLALIGVSVMCFLFAGYELYWYRSENTDSS